MNQIAVGLIIGGIVGFGIGLTLAPDVALSSMTEDQHELLCLEERSQLMGEVREALKKMQDAECAPATPAVDQRVAKVSDSPTKVEPASASPPVETTQPTGVGTEPKKTEAKSEVQQAKPVDKQIKPVPAAPAIPVEEKTQPKASKLTSASAWMVQLVASPDPAEAGKVERKARALGLSTRVVLEEVPDQSRSLYKVRVGPFTDKSGGVEALRRIKRELKITGWLHRAD